MRGSRAFAAPVIYGKTHPRRLAGDCIARGYTIRQSRPGDGPHWERIIREEFEDDRYDLTFFEQHMVHHPDCCRERTAGCAGEMEHLVLVALPFLLLFVMMQARAVGTEPGCVAGDGNRYPVEG